MQSLPIQDRTSARQAASEALIDLAWQERDVPAVMLQVFSHVRSRHRKDEALAATIALEIERRLPGYRGADKLGEYDGRIPLSHYCNMLAKSRSVDALRRVSRLKQHETLSCDLARRDDGQDALGYLSDLEQHTPVVDQGIAYDEFVESLPATQRPALARCLTSGRISDGDRRAFNRVVASAKQWGEQERATVHDIHASGCPCFNCGPSKSCFRLADLPARRPRPNDA